MESVSSHLFAGLAVSLIALSAHRAFAQEPKPEVRFANPHLLVDTAWLARHAADDALRIVDARSAEDYAAGHIPGAVSIPRSATFEPGKPGSLVASPERIAELFGSKGIDGAARIVVYDEGASTAAARVFWTLEFYGLRSVSVLDGGWKKWRSEQRAIATEETAVQAAKFVARADESKLSTKELVLKDVGSESSVMLDARSEREFSAGRVPGAVHIEWTRNFTSGEVPVFRSPAELRALYADAGVSKDKRIHAY